MCVNNVSSCIRKINNYRLTFALPSILEPTQDVGVRNISKHTSKPQTQPSALDQSDISEYKCERVNEGLMKQNR